MDPRISYPQRNNKMRQVPKLLAKFILTLLFQNLTLNLLTLSMNRLIIIIFFNSVMNQLLLAGLNPKIKGRIIRYLQGIRIRKI